MAASHPSPPSPPPAFTHTWRIRRWLPERFGLRCRIVAVGKRNAVLVEFEDGARFVTVRYFIRRAGRL